MQGKFMVGLVVAALLGGSAGASENGRTTYIVSRSHTQVTTEVRVGSSPLARRRLAAMASRLRELPMVTSVSSSAPGCKLMLRLDPPAPVELRLVEHDGSVRVQSEFLGKAPNAKPGNYLARLASVMKAINERLANAP